MSRLSETLTARAAELKISQTELAERLGMAQQSISAVFTGLVAHPRKWRELARELKIPEESMREMMIDAGSDPEKNTKIPLSVSRLGKEDIVRLSDQAHHEPNGTIDRTPIPMTIGKPTRMLPVLGEVVGGDDGQYDFNGTVLDWVACPPSLANVPDAYAVWIDGESMYPRFKSGELAYVHPRKPARKGDDVVVQVRPRVEDMPPRGFVKELVGYSGDKLVLKQFNPDVRIEFPRDDVVSIHVITLSGKY